MIPCAVRKGSHKAVPRSSKGRRPHACLGTFPEPGCLRLCARPASRTSRYTPSHWSLSTPRVPWVAEPSLRVLLRAVPVDKLDDDPVRVTDLERALPPLLDGQRHGDCHALGLQPGQLALQILDDEARIRP